MNIAHIVPANDLKPHVTGGEWCHCAPRIQHEGEDKLVIHNSYDGREFFETRPLEHDWELADAT